MQELIPITLFICIAYAIHAIADARARSKLVAPHVPEEVIRSLAVLEEERRRQGAQRVSHEPEERRHQELLAPFGLDDVFAMVIRPNPTRPIAADWDRVIDKLVARWPELTVECDR